MKKRKICVVSGTRAEYGLLFWLMKEIQADPELELQIIATGMHLSPEFGLTYREIEADGFAIDAKVEMLVSSDTGIGIAKSIGLGIIGMADAVARLEPDIMVILGDRYEMLAAAQAAMTARIPIAHIHGGEATEGLIDEAIRHALTKMAHLHFPAAEVYRQRIIKMGENPARVFNCGAPGLDNIQKIKLLSRTELESAIAFDFGKLNFLVTYHPVTLDKNGPEAAMRQLFAALDNFPDAKIIFTKSNADHHGRLIGQMIDEYEYEHGDRIKSFTSMGQLRYSSAIRQVDAVIGNSSSGIIEVPFLHKPTINIGKRQNGRLKAASVIDCAETAESITAAIKQALSPEFQRTLPQVVSPYGSGNAAHNIKETIKKAELTHILVKQFYE